MVRNNFRVLSVGCHRPGTLSLGRVAWEGSWEGSDLNFTLCIAKCTWEGSYLGRVRPKLYTLHRKVYRLGLTLRHESLEEEEEM